MFEEGAYSFLLEEVFLILSIIIKINETYL